MSQHSAVAHAASGEDARGRWWLWLSGVVLLVALALGLFARAHNLGMWPLAIDEYYSARSIEFILEHGVPEFPSGGYYFRSPVFHYLTAGAAALLGADEFGFRLPAVLFGLLGVALAYLYARRFVTLAVAAALAIALLLSSWQIEFARFVRMYTLLQGTTLLFLIVLDDAFFRGHWERRYLPHGVAVLAVLSHQLGALLTPLLFVPFLLGRATGLPAGWRPRLAYGALSLLTTLLCLAFTFSDTRDFGVSAAPLPADYTVPPGLHGPLTYPAFPFWGLPGDPWTTLALVLLAAATLMVVLFALRRRGRPIQATDLLVALVVLFSLVHLFIPAAVVLLILVLRYDLHRVRLHPPRTYALLLLAALIGAGWVAYALAFPDLLMVPAVTLRWDVSEAGLLKALWTTFFGWPDLYRATIRPFLVELPVVALLAVLALAWSLVHHRHDPLPALLRHPAFFVLYTALLYGILSPEWSTSRYWFHVYPVVLCVVALASQEIAGQLTRRGAAAAPAAALGFLVAFALTSDFNPRHLMQAGSEAVAFRTGPFEPYAPTWYRRADVETPAAFVERAVEPDATTAVVAENLPPVSHYLGIEHAIYYIREGQRFRITSRKGGTRDVWSDMRLLSTPGELAEYTRGAREVWLIREVERFPLLPEPEEVWGDRLRGRERAFVSRDGRIEVLHLKLTPLPPSDPTLGQETQRP